MWSQRDSLCDACCLHFHAHACKQTRTHTRARTRARIPPRVRVLRDTHSTRWHSAPCVDTRIDFYIMHPCDSVRAYMTSVRDEQMRTCVNVQDLVAFANDAGTMYRTQFSIVLYIRYIGTVRLHLLANVIACLDQSRFRKRDSVFQKRRFPCLSLID